MEENIAHRKQGNTVHIEPTVVAKESQNSESLLSEPATKYYDDSL
jgi:hypothetical protein